VSRDVPAPRRSAFVAFARVAAAALLPVAALVLSFAGAGCERKKFEPIKADSTVAINPDSFAIRAREVQMQWEGTGGEGAARLTADLLLADLRSRSYDDPGPGWQSRAAALFDSLGVGAEYGSARCVLVANFFLRADPSRGSWPWLFTCGAKTVEAQPIEGRDLRLLDVASRGVPSARDTSTAPGVAVLFGRRAASGYQPMLMSWTRAKDGHWQMQQTLGPDSLGGFGSAEFVQSDTALEVIARTYRPAPRFEECATCPHIFTVRRLGWGATGFSIVEDRPVLSPYATFVRFVTALSVNDREITDDLVTDRQWVDFARRAGFGEAHGNWRAAPATDETAHEMVFLRGKDEAWRVSFLAQGGDWKISGITSTSGVIE
jgi:hypothetical protein